jgi:hypothetical protein
MKFLPLALLSLISLVGARSVSPFGILDNIDTLREMTIRLLEDWDVNVLAIDVSHSSHMSAVADSAAV